MFLEQYSKGMSYDLACSIWQEKFSFKKNDVLIKLLKNIQKAHEIGPYEHDLVIRTIAERTALCIY